MKAAMEAQVSVVVTILFMLLVQFGLAQQVSSGSSIERSALLSLRTSLGLRGKDWPIKKDPCTWVGLRCRSGRVIGITVSGLKRTRLGRLNPRFAVDSLANLTHLVSFNASGFSLLGSIPDWFGQQLSGLQVLDLRYASIFGAIPQSIGNLGRLSSLYLSDNNLTGNIPSTLGQLSELSILDLSMNFLIGSIPSSFSSLRNLTRLDLSSNFLSGAIPPNLSNLSRLQSLNLSDNSLSASVPVELGNLSQLVELNLSKNYLSGLLPLELRGLRNLRMMNIGDNSLGGPVPKDLFLNLAQLQNVVLSGNKLDGALPVAFWSIPNLYFLDLSRNNFTGSLPSLSSSVINGAVFNLSNNQLYGNLTSLFWKFSSVDFSSNYFEGKVPENGQSNATLTENCLQMVPNQRSLQDCRLFYAQRGLTVNNFGGTDPAKPPETKPESKSKNKLIFILVGAFGGLVFIVLLVLIMVVLLKFCNKGTANQRSSANVGPVPEGDSPSPHKDITHLSGVGQSFTYEQMVHFTGNFNENNLIKNGHSGDLFQGYLESGIPIVIKRVDLSSVKKESYVVELDFFRKISHTRLVPLLGYCLEHDNEKFLLYKYMRNGDLANSLHRSTSTENESLQSLDWITRLKIATGAAEFLAYLHHECTPPLVHRDVQASSILLDDKFEVRFGSLSEVHVQEGEANQHVLTRLLRKPQTSEQGPPCSGSSMATCAQDVYCFGKVLLELVTGKLGISEAEDTSTREWLEHTLRYVNMYEKDMVTKIIDPSLIIDEDLLEEVWAMAIIAKSCLNPKPSRRPLMKYILKALENPLKVVRVESSSSARLRTTSSTRSWSATVFGSWRQSFSESAVVPGHTNRENMSGLKQPGRLGSQSSGGEFSSSRKRLSNEIFPEPVEMQDLERQDE